MKGFILAAGIGSRLKPWTDSHPKALAQADGIPMLQRVVEKMYDSGITDITVNVYHFAEQIIDFIKTKGWNINISDERPELLETGGALLYAEKFLTGDEPILVHNADILSNADMRSFEAFHNNHNNDVSLLVSDRDSSRKLIFNNDNRLLGWHSLKTDEYKPQNFEPKLTDKKLAFSGIYIVSPAIFGEMRTNGFSGRFPIMDFFLHIPHKINIMGYEQQGLNLLDIGKPESLARAGKVLNLF